MNRLRALKLSPSAWIGLAMVATFVVLGIFGPWIAPYDVSEKTIDLAHKFEHPSAAHWFGTDSNGRDTLSQLLFGARSALMLSGITVAITSVIGLALGTIAGWFRGWVDEVLMRIVDILLAFPGILMNIAIVATVANPSVGVVILALSVNGWVGYARVARAQVLALREREFVTAAIALGASNRRVMWKHLLPNLMGPALVQMSFGLGGVIPDRSRPLLPRPRPAGRLHLGRDARPSPRLPLEGRLGPPPRVRARPRRHVGRARRKSPRRRAARSARSAAARQVKIQASEDPGK